MPRTAPRFVRRGVGLLLGYAWTARARGPALLVLAFAAILAAAGGAAAGARVWPSANDPALEPSDNPGIRRDGDRLVFDPPTRWSGRVRRSGRLLAFEPRLDAESARARGDWGAATPGTYVYGADYFAETGPGGAAAFRAADFEARLRLAAAATTSVVFLVAFPLLVLAARLLLRARGAPAPGAAALRIALRAAVPAGFAAAVAGLGLRAGLPSSAPLVAAFAVAAAGVLLGATDGASAAADPSKEPAP